MTIVNNDRVCPTCGGYSQAECDGHCTNGHYTKDEDWITQEEFNERKYLVPRIECVEFQTIWDGGIEKYTPALLNLATGEITVEFNEIDGLYFRDSQAIIIKYKSGLTSVYEVIDDAGDYSVSEEDISLIRALYESAEKHNDVESKSWSSNRVQEIETDKASLEVYECECGYHMGFDLSYLDQVVDFVSAECPSCGDLIRTHVETDPDTNQYCVKLDEFTYFYAQGWTNPQGDEIDYAEDVIDIREYGDAEIESALLSMYGNNLAHLKEECGESWKQLVAEYLFEYSVSF